MADLFSYPRAAGYQSPPTSKAAAASMNASLNPLQDAVYRAVAAWPKTADEVASVINKSVLSVRPRVAELRELKKIVDSGTRRKNQSGRSAIVWKSA